MRPSAIRSTITSTAEAVVPLDKRTARDRFVASERRVVLGGSAPDRAFEVFLSSQSNTLQVYGDDLRIIEYLFRVRYSMTSTVEDRVADDAGLLVTAFDGMFRDEPDIQNVTVTPLGIDDTTVENALLATWSIAVEYRHTAGA